MRDSQRLSRRLTIYGVTALGVGVGALLGGTLPAFHDPVRVCDAPGFTLAAVGARLTAAEVASVVPSRVACLWEYEGDTVRDEIPVNQAGQLFGSGMSGVGLTLVGLAAIARREAQPKR